MKIRLVGVAVFHAERQKNEFLETHMTTLIVIFRQLLGECIQNISRNFEVKHPRCVIQIS